MNIAEHLKNTPIGAKLYSPILGDVIYMGYNTVNSLISVDTVSGHTYTFNRDGKFCVPDRDNGEIMLFPSRANRNWDTYMPYVPIKFKTFDKVVARYEKGMWSADFFSHYNRNSKFPYTTIGNIQYDECLPYNEETSKLIGTYDDYEM